VKADQKARSRIRTNSGGMGTLTRITNKPSLGVIAEFSRKSTLRVSAIRHGLATEASCFSFGGLGSGLAVARDVDQGEPSSFFWQIVGVGFDEYFDGFVAGMDFDTQRAVLEIDFVPPSGFTANNCMGHLRAYKKLKG
jgi:hypothetical protein